MKNNYIFVSSDLFEETFHKSEALFISDGVSTNNDPELPTFIICDCSGS